MAMLGPTVSADAREGDQRVAILGPPVSADAKEGGKADHAVTVFGNSMPVFGSLNTSNLSARHTAPSTLACGTADGI